MSEDLLKHIIEIKEALARVSTQCADLKEDITEHRAESKDDKKVMRKEIDVLQKDANKAKGALALLAIVGTLVKAFEYLR